MKVIITLSLLSLALLVMLIATTKKYMKTKSEAKKYKDLYQNMIQSASKIEENIANANKEKQKLNTGDTDTDVANATDILHKYASKHKA